MMADRIKKYSAFPKIPLSDRRWPDRSIEKAPIWCSVDLRDGNQALIEPMGAERKMRMYKKLVAIGVKEIEVGFPAASQTDFDFIRTLIDNKLIPDDVTVQVLTQARDSLIERTFEAIDGAHRAIVHLYNSTSTLQRRVVFGMNEGGITDIAIKGAARIRELADRTKTHIVYEYSPESFTGTELPFARSIVEAVQDVWKPTEEHRMIVNLPSTVEMSTPNIYADQIEWFARNVRNREAMIISLHTHNDRGSAVAASELGLMAGGDRVEGTLFGNGERTGNADMITLALNMFTQGIDPGLDLSDINSLVEMSEFCTQLPVPPRHPYAGELVFTAFSGSHQDAIKKGFAALRSSNSEEWSVPYLPIDPADIGRSYEAVIRVNSQSGKGGIAYLLQTDHGLELPRELQVEFSRIVQKVADSSGKELSSDDIWSLFQETYITPARKGGALHLADFTTRPEPGHTDMNRLEALMEKDGNTLTLHGTGNGPIDAFVDAMLRGLNISFSLESYHEHASGHGANAIAAAYVGIKGLGGQKVYGVGLHANIVSASLQAIVSAVIRGAREKIL